VDSGGRRLSNSSRKSSALDMPGHWWTVLNRSSTTAGRTAPTRGFSGSRRMRSSGGRRRERGEPSCIFSPLKAFSGKPLPGMIPRGPRWGQATGPNSAGRGRRVRGAGRSRGAPGGGGREPLVGVFTRRLTTPPAAERQSRGEAERQGAAVVLYRQTWPKLTAT
jgi:hypothetical protein